MTNDDVTVLVRRLSKRAVEVSSVYDIMPENCWEYKAAAALTDLVAERDTWEEAYHQENLLYVESEARLAAAEKVVEAEESCLEPGPPCPDSTCFRCRVVHALAAHDKEATDA